MLYKVRITVAYDGFDDMNYIAIVNGNSYTDCVEKIQNEFKDENIRYLSTEEISPDNVFYIDEKDSYYDKFNELIKEYEKNVIW